MSRPIARRRRASIRLAPGVAALERRLLPSADVLTYHDDNTRSGWDPDEPTLTPADVTPSSFGKLFNMPVDGQVYAQPLYDAGVNIPGQGVHNVLYVATEADSVYAFDADSGALLWRVSMLGPGETPSGSPAGVQITPVIGITATPVIDPTTGRIYVEAMSAKVSGGATTYYQRLHALSIATGADVVPAESIDGSITYPGTGPGGNGSVVIFDPKQYKERDALLLSGGVVYTSWASHADNPPYTGWVIGFRASDLSVASVLNIDPAGRPTSSFLDDGSGNSFWNSGDGPAVDAQGNLYNISANGPFDPNLNVSGFPTNGDYGDSILKMTPSADGLAVTDYFTPADQQRLADVDFDLGSSGIALADEPGVDGTIEHLAIGSDKQGDIFVVNRDDMGRFNASGDTIFQELPGALGNGLFGAPAVYGGIVYFAGVGQTLRAFSFVDGRLVPGGQTTTTFPYPGATPTVSSYGVTNGIVWAIEYGAGAVLHAYLATNPAVELYNSTMAPGGRDALGIGNKFATPTVANGKVYAATASGVAAFGLLLTPPPIFTQPPRAAANPTAGGFVTLSTQAVDASYPPTSLAYFWGALATPPGAAAPLFSDSGTDTARTTVAYVSTPGTYIFLVVVADPSNNQTNCVTVVQDIIPTPSAARALAASPAVAPAPSPGKAVGASAAPAPPIEHAASVETLALAPTGAAAPVAPAPVAAGSPAMVSPRGVGRVRLIPQEWPEAAASYPLGDRRSSPRRWLRGLAP